MTVMNEARARPKVVFMAENYLNGLNFGSRKMAWRGCGRDGAGEAGFHGGRHNRELLFKLSTPSFQFPEYLRRLFQLRQRTQLLPDVMPVQLPGLPDDDPNFGS